MVAHTFRPLKLFILIDAILQKHGSEIEWDSFLSNAERFGMRNLTGCTLKIAHELLGMSAIPNTIRDKNFPGYQIVIKLITRGMFIEKSLFFIKLTSYLLLLAGPFPLLRVSKKALFPSPAKMRRRYNLPPDSNLVYLYYFLNPFLIMKMKS